MSAGSRADPEAFRRLDLEAHRLLAGVPLHDVWRVDLPGGGPGRSLADVRSLLAFESVARTNPAVRFLFRLRGWLGTLFRWDAAGSEPAAADARSFLARVPDSLRRRSDPEPGSQDGPFTLLYALEREAVSEVRNATVHAFSVLALEPGAEGYRLHWAIYVAPVGRFTGLYMALIDPFRRLLIYPAVLRHLRRAWASAYGGP